MILIPVAALTTVAALPSVSPPHLFRTVIASSLLFSPKVPVRFGGGYSAEAKPSRWEWDKLKDDVHFYVLLSGTAPAQCLCTCTCTVPLHLHLHLRNF